MTEWTLAINDNMILHIRNCGHAPPDFEWYLTYNDNDEEAICTSDHKFFDKHETYDNFKKMFDVMAEGIKNNE